MKETEITVQIFDDYNTIDKTLTDLGFKMVENYQLNDWYFTKLASVANLSYIDLMNNSFLIRQVIDNNPKIQLCYKKKELDNFGNVIMEEKIKTELTDLEKAINIFKMSGLNNYCLVQNNSYVYQKGNTEFVVQIIKDLGIFIEYEETPDMVNLPAKEKFNYMVDAIKKIGLKIGNDFSCKKVFMLLHK